MNKGFGIAALVIAIVSIFIPLLGPWIAVVAGGLAAFAYGPGFALGISAIVINLINTFLLSPSVWIAMGASAAAASQGKPLISLGMMFLVAQIIAFGVLLLLHNKSKSRAQAGAVLDSSKS